MRAKIGYARIPSIQKVRVPGADVIPTSPVPSTTMRCVDVTTRFRRLPWQRCTRRRWLTPAEMRGGRDRWCSAPTILRISQTIGFEDSLARRHHRKSDTSKHAMNACTNSERYSRLLRTAWTAAIVLDESRTSPVTPTASARPLCFESNEWIGCGTRHKSAHNIRRTPSGVHRSRESGSCVSVAKSHRVVPIF